MSDQSDFQPKPSLLTRRWKNIKTSMYHLVEAHDKHELIHTLVKLREEHTGAPTLSEITNFTGYDVAIHTCANWNWKPTGETRNLETDAAEIGKYGAELMIVHTLRESIHNGLLSWDGKNLIETKQGEVHFQTLNSFNVDITGSRMDIARKRFSQGRLTKEQRKMDPINKIPSVKRLYWENSILMLLRAPLPFYHAMSVLTDKEREYLLELHSKLVSKAKKDSSGMVTVRLRKNSMAAGILEKLTPQYNEDDLRPRFVACVRDRATEEEDAEYYHVGLGGLTMFILFLNGFVKDHLDEKAQRAEYAVREVIEHTGYWKVINSNIEVTRDEGEVITEIDIIARSTLDSEQWLACEVKDFSFWRGWIYGHGAERRRSHYIQAAEKLPVKENYIKSEYSCKNIRSIIVTSIPEPYQHIEGIPLVYLSDLSEHLAKLSQVNHSPRKRHTSSNFLIRYFERLQTDYLNADKLDLPMDKIEKQKRVLKKEASKIKEEYSKIRTTYNRIKSDYDTLAVSEKLASKRLLRDTGEKHYQLEAELKMIRSKKSKINRDRKIKASTLRELKKTYATKLQQIKEKEKERTKLEKSKNRLLGPRLF